MLEKQLLKWGQRDRKDPSLQDRTSRLARGQSDGGTQIFCPVEHANRESVFSLLSDELRPIGVDDCYFDIGYQDLRIPDNKLGWRTFSVCLHHSGELGVRESYC